jgi:Amt family ammonium transporter
MGCCWVNVVRLLKQLVGIVAVGAYAFVATLILGKLVDVTTRLRACQPEEMVNLDISQHSEKATAS